MPPAPFHQLSDEPLYCEAVHDKDDDVFYSGSEDDHYEGPLHRRLHIEKKAVDFLSGNVPILISAALRGPFDRKQWNNPWRSTRAESHCEPCRAQPTHSEEDIPDTQGTSLYPLPSPETTNPPSAKKNPYMDEQDYSRVKTWREAVKITSASKDPFLQPQLDDKYERLPPRKRSADSTWLHNRDRKKPRPANQGSSVPDDSPSHGAARTRGRQARQLHASQMVAQFLRHSSPPEDELAVDGHTRPLRSSTSPVVKKNMGLTPRRVKWRFEVPDNSDDELSLPATTPTSKAIRTSTMVSASLTRDQSPIRLKNATESKSRPPKGRSTSSRGRAKFKKPQAAQPSPSQGSGHDETGASSRMAAQVVEAAPESMDVSHQTSFTNQSKPLWDQPLSDTSDPNSMFLSQNLVALPSAQQDNSFLFHKRARNPTTGSERGRSTSVSKERVTLSQSSPQPHAANMDEQKDQPATGDDLAAPTLSNPEIVTTKKSGVEQNSSIGLPRLSRDPGISLVVDEGSMPSHNQPEQQTRFTDDHKANDETKIVDESIAKVEPDARENSAEVVQLRNTNGQWIAEEPQSLPHVDGCAQSDSDWSTYLDAEDRTPASASEKEVTKKSADKLVAEYGVDGASDPEWSTFVNTQDTTPILSNLEVDVDPEEFAYQQIGSDKIALTNAHCLPTASLDAATMAHENAHNAPVGARSPGLASHTGDAPEIPTPGVFLRDQMHFQGSVGSIIDAYAEFSVLSNSPGLVTAEKPAERLITEAEVSKLPCSLPNQIITVSVDGIEVHNENVADEKQQQHQATPQRSEVAEPLLSLTCHPTKSDHIPPYECTRNVDDLSGPVRQTVSAPVETTGCNGGSSSLNDPGDLQLPSPWGQVATSSFQMAPQVPNNETEPVFHSDGLDEAAAQLQSPWNDNTDIASPWSVPPMTYISPTGSIPDLSVLAGKALAMSQQPQSPWEPKTPAAPNPPAQDFEMSIRAFSDFMSPSPVKQRASLNTNLARSSSVRPGVLFKTPAQRKPDRRVQFAPLPGEQEKCFTEFDGDGIVAICDEEEVSYFGPSGKKTGTMRMPKPMMRPASPPPTEMSSVEAGGLPDHDQKFAKHFEAMSKRKSPSRKPLRLLPSESQQTVTASQEVGAMAEAFMQASQTRKRSLELAAAKQAECRSEFADRTFVSAAMDVLEDQENVDPVDDVSLVLDNLDKFLDDTWGIDMGTGESPADDARSKQEKETALSHGGAQKVEDPMFDLEANVWAD